MHDRIFPINQARSGLLFHQPREPASPHKERKIEESKKIESIAPWSRDVSKKLM